MFFTNIKDFVDRLLRFVEQALTTGLTWGNMVIWDHWPAHKAPALTSSLTSIQATQLPLPPYSPDFTSIEQGWSKVKEFLRAAVVRTNEVLERLKPNGSDLSIYQTSQQNHSGPSLIIQDQGETEP